MGDLYKMFKSGKLLKQGSGGGTVNNAKITIQKNGTTVDSFTSNQATDKTINITVPTSAADVSALPDTTKYATALSLTINSSTFVMTGQLKDQNGDNLGTAQTIDLPLESVVVGGSYNSQTQKVVLTLQNGNTIEFSVADLVSGLQTELSASNKLNPAYIDYDSTHRAVSDTEKSTWNGKQSALTTEQLAAVNSGITSADVAQITTNKNNISNVQTSLAVGSSDNGKVLTASYSGGTGSYAWVTPSGGGGTTDYTLLENKPQINSVTLTGNKSLSDLGITYESKTAASGGTALSLVTTGEKYTWDSKQSAISDLSTIRSGAALGATAVQPEAGKGLSTNDYTTAEKTKLAGIAEGAEVNVQSNWTQTTTTADDYIKNKPTLGTAAAKNATDTYNATGTDVTTGKAVAAALATLPEPMVFIGSLGTGGTITTLPTASSSNKGYVYKVITAGTYASQSAKVGDTFISDGSIWVLIPSGDEPSGTVTNVAVANGGGLTVSGSPITSSGTITVGHSNSVTAKTSSSLKKFTYDAHGHVTGSSELSTAESNALASGINSTKVAQIATNEANISSLQKSAVNMTVRFGELTWTATSSGMFVSNDVTVTGISNIESILITSIYAMRATDYIMPRTNGARTMLKFFANTDTFADVTQSGYDLYIIGTPTS